MNLQTGKTRISKKVLCVILSFIMAFGTFITFTVGYSPLHELLGIRNMWSAYGAEFVDTAGAVAVDEDAMLADDHTINLENKDGSNTVYLFSEPISYTDDNGDLKTKDISVEKANSELKKEGYDFTNGQNDYRINFSKDYNKGIQAEFEGASYSIIPQSIIKVDGEEAVAEYLNENFEVFQYKNIYGNGTNLRFYPQLNGVKDEIILNQNINKNTFSFELKTENCTAQLNEDGTISLVNKEGTIIQTFAAPFAYDSEYVEGDNTNHYVDCEYTLEDKDETSYIMTITVPDEWLNSAITKYPVTIDPTTSNISQAKDAGTYKKYKTQNWGSEQLCCFGYSHDYDKGRVYTQFTLPTAIKRGAAINSAYQGERECTGRTTSTKVIGYMVKASWSETGITWENKPGYNSNYASNKRTINSNSSDNNSPYWYKFSIKSIVNQWINGGSANYGITFRSDEEDNLNYNWRAFAAKNHSTSSYRPYTVINYTNDATAPTATGVSGNPTSWVKSATLKITGAKDNSGGVGLHSKPYSMSTEKGTYNWQASNSFTVTASGKYYFYVRDAYSNIRLIKDPNDKDY
ncbi:DNRLRE domain-containing protein, partial [bacterium]|nr:DNRLRE domain-containing protein [bacterium]